MQTRKHGPVCRILSGKVLSPTDNGHGYLSVQLGSNVRRYVHRLVCEAFHGPAPKNHQVAHRDGNRKNNAPNNLRWATVKENMNDKLLHGTLVYGETQHNSKLKEKDVLKIRSSSAGLLSLAREYGVTTDTIWKAKTGQSWKQVIGHDG
jgi:hypothetical protein